MTKDELSKELNNTVKLLEKIKSEVNKTKGVNYLTVKQVKEKTGVCPSCIYAWLRRDDNPLPHYLMGKIRGIRIREDELDEWLEQFHIYPRQRVERLVKI